MDVGFSDRLKRNEHPASLAMTVCLIPEEERDSFPVPLARLGTPRSFALEPGSPRIPPFLRSEPRSFHVSFST